MLWHGSDNNCLGTSVIITYLRFVQIVLCDIVSLEFAIYYRIAFPVAPATPTRTTSDVWSSTMVRQSPCLQQRRRRRLCLTRPPASPPPRTSQPPLLRRILLHQPCLQPPQLQSPLQSPATLTLRDREERTAPGYTTSTGTSAALTQIPTIMTTTTLAGKIQLEPPPPQHRVRNFRDIFFFN